MRITLTILSMFTLATRRIWNHRLLTLCLLLGLVVAVGLLSSVPLYADAVRNRLLQGELTDVREPQSNEVGAHRPPFAFPWRYVGRWHGNVTWEDYEPVNAYLAEQAPGIMGLPVEFQIHHVASDKLRLFPTEDAAFIPDELLMWASVGFVTGLYEHIQLLEGRFPTENQPGEAVEILISHKITDTLGLRLKISGVYSFRLSLFYPYGCLRCAPVICWLSRLRYASRHNQRMKLSIAADQALPLIGLHRLALAACPRLVAATGSPEMCSYTNEKEVLK